MCAQRVAIVDGASFVLPYDLQLVEALVRAGAEVGFFGSRTLYNGELLDRMRSLPGVRVDAAAVSGSVAPRWRGVLAYVALGFRLWRQRDRYPVINLQFGLLGLLEWPLWWLLRHQLVYTVHNPVPHGFAGRRHRSTASLAGLARQLVFASQHSCDDFLQRYGERWRAKCVVMPHGLLPPAPGMAPVPYQALRRPQALVFWGNVQAYKGVELFEALAQSPQLRERGLTLEVHGAWAPELRPLAARLVACGVRVNAAFLDAASLQALLRRDVVFLLPYHRATQSGALFSLLHQGRVMLCSDVGDLGHFLHRHGLQALLLVGHSPAAVLAALDRLEQDAEGIASRLAQAQRQCGWDGALQAARAVYLPGAPPSV